MAFDYEIWQTPEFIKLTINSILGYQVNGYTKIKYIEN